MSRRLRNSLLATLAFLPAAFGQGVTAPLDCGTVASGSLTANVSDFYNLTAQPGDSILIRFLTSSTDAAFKPRAVVVDRVNRVVSARTGPSSSAANPVAAGATFAAEYDLVLGGSYQIQVQNLSPAQGSYRLVYTWLNRACGSAAGLACGVSSLDQITAPLQLKSYQFAASAGDILSARIVRIGASGTPFNIAMFVYSAAGQLTPTVTGPPASGDTAGNGFRRLDFPAPADGIFTIVVFDAANAGGNFALSVTKLKGQCGGGALACGSVSQGTIGGPLSLAAFSVSLVPGDVVSLRYSATDPNSRLAPLAEVYDPQGASVPIRSAGVASRLFATSLFTAPSAGSYLVLVGDSNLVNTGGFVISLLRLNRPCNASQAPLGCSARVDGSVNGRLGIAQYSLNAGANDQYLLRLLRTDQSGSFRPHLDIYDAQGNLFQTLSTSDLTRLTFTAPAGGLYSLVVSDEFDGTQSGAYAFSLQRLNGSCNAGPALSCGAVAQGSFALPLDASVYTFAAAAGGSFSVRMLDNSGALQPDLEIYDAQGNMAGQNISGSYTGVDVTQPAGGTYTILAMDASRRPTAGAFAIDVLQTVNACAAPAPQGQTVSGVVSGSQPFLSYRLPAAAGDMLLARSASLTPGFSAQMDLYDPTGARLDSASFAVSRKISTAGTYTVIVSASAARAGGGYALSWQLLNHPAGASPLPCGGSATASLTASSQFRYYAAAAGAGDVMRMIFTKLSDNFAPQIELFDPAGSRLAQTSDLTQKAAVDGGYLVVVSPSTSAAETGSYSIAYQRPNNPCSPAPLTCGQTTLRRVVLPGQLDAFTFAGIGGDQADIRLTQRTGSYFPLAELYDGAGNRLAVSSSGVLRYTPSAGSTYSLLVRDRAAVNIGSYRISLQDGANACPVNDSEAPAVILLQPTGGEVIPGGTLYRIQWQSDDNAAVSTHDVALSMDGGQTFGAAIAAGLSGSQQSFDWTVPPDIAPSRKAVIRVTATDTAGNSGAASSGLLTIIGSGFTPNSTAANTYDEMNRLTQTMVDDVRTMRYVWDATGNLLQIIVTGK